MSRAIEPDELADETRLGRLLSRVEGGMQGARDVLGALPAPPVPLAGLGLQRIGVTGSPGVGKSSLLNRLIALLREHGHRVGVIAVDPTSPLTGGAILGDRLRLAPQTLDAGLFIRSLGSHGSLGGVTPGASAVAAVLEAAGYDRILIETVGVGQTGYDVVCLADTVIALVSPEGGDGLQMLKAGMLEVGDIFAVNKSDRSGAELMLKEIKFSLELGGPGSADCQSAPERAESRSERDSALPEPSAPAAPPWRNWRPPVIRLSAKSGEGVSEVAAAAEAHRLWLAALPAGHPRLAARTARELAFVLRSRTDALVDLELREQIAERAAEVHAGRLNLWDAVAQLLVELRQRL